MLLQITSFNIILIKKNICFRPAIFDLDKIYVWLLCSGGTTGVLKLAAYKHKLCLDKLYDIVKKLYKKVDSDVRSVKYKLMFNFN